MNLNKKQHSKQDHIHIGNNTKVLINGCICNLELWNKGKTQFVVIAIINTSAQTKKFTLKDSYTLEEIRDRIRTGKIVKC